MIKKLERIYIKEQYNPKILGLFINPFYFARKGLYKNVSELISKLNGSLLDVGCGTKPYKTLCNVKEYIGLEISDKGNKQHKHADVFYDGNIIPFKDNNFDSILSSQVFEHVFNPNNFVIMSLPDFEDKELLSVNSFRTKVEYFCSCSISY